LGQEKAIMKIKKVSLKEVTLMFEHVKKEFLEEVRKNPEIIFTWDKFKGIEELREKTFLRLVEEKLGMDEIKLYDFLNENYDEMLKIENYPPDHDFHHPFSLESRVDRINHIVWFLNKRKK
jgi:hypothetical protein